MRNLDSLIKDLINSRAKTPDDLSLAKRRFAKKYRIPCPGNIALLKTYHELVKRKSINSSGLIEILLRTRPVRSLSGIVNVSVLTKPHPCPGKCLYCPTEKGIPKSYVSGEPAVERAKRLKYDPYLQAKKRIETLEAEGHPTDKIELRVVGGTWSFYPQKYRERFIKRCFDACNNINNVGGGASLNAAQKRNETAKHRVVGLSIETRPDFINEEEIKNLRKLGVTMVELGVQSIYDDVLRKNQRGHLVKNTEIATKLLKDAGFKVLYQIMPNLYGTSLARDLKTFKTIFSDSRFQPDMLKIYPCALLKSSPLFRVWKKGGYKPYTEKQLIGLIKAIKKILPYYVRVQRIARDIPSKSIVEGPAKISNLRQMVSGICRCIRCREVKWNYDPEEKIKLFKQNYEASGGKEIFLSFCAQGASASGGENSPGRLFSLLRLRITSQNNAIIRELHTYGQAKTIDGGEASNISPQHQGLGRRLIEEAEKIAKKEFKSRLRQGYGGQGKKIAVISGVGAREYYRKLGYKLENTYMVKTLG